MIRNYYRIYLSIAITIVQALRLQSEASLGRQPNALKQGRCFVHSLNANAKLKGIMQIRSKNHLLLFCSS